MPISGLQRIGSVSILSVIEEMHLGLSLSLQASGCMGLAVLALDFLRLDFSTPLRGSIRIESAFSALQVARFEPLASILDGSTLGSFLPIQSFVCLDLALLTLDFSHHELPVPLHSHI